VHCACRAVLRAHFERLAGKAATDKAEQHLISVSAPFGAEQQSPTPRSASPTEEEYSTESLVANFTAGVASPETHRARVSVAAGALHSTHTSGGTRGRGASLFAAGGVGGRVTMRRRTAHMHVQQVTHDMARPSMMLRQGSTATDDALDWYVSVVLAA
jgi:hypothetical protein